MRCCGSTDATSRAPSERRWDTDDTLEGVVTINRGMSAARQTPYLAELERATALWRERGHAERAAYVRGVIERKLAEWQRGGARATCLRRDY